MDKCIGRVGVFRIFIIGLGVSESLCLLSKLSLISGLDIGSMMGKEFSFGMRNGVASRV